MKAGKTHETRQSRSQRTHDVLSLFLFLCAFCEEGESTCFSPSLSVQLFSFAFFLLFLTVCCVYSLFLSLSPMLSPSHLSFSLSLALALPFSWLFSLRITLLSCTPLPLQNERHVRLVNWLFFIWSFSLNGSLYWCSFLTLLILHHMCVCVCGQIVKNAYATLYPKCTGLRRWRWRQRQRRRRQWHTETMVKARERRVKSETTVFKRNQACIDTHCHFTRRKRKE